MRKSLPVALALASAVLFLTELTGCGKPAPEVPIIAELQTQTPSNPAGRPGLRSQTPNSPTARPEIPQTLAAEAPAETPPPAQRTRGMQVEWTPEQAAEEQQRTAIRFSGLRPNTEFKFSCRAKTTSGAPTTIYLVPKGGAPGEMKDMEVASVEGAGDWQEHTFVVPPASYRTLELVVRLRTKTISTPHALMLDSLKLQPMRVAANASPSSGDNPAAKDSPSTPASTAVADAGTAPPETIPPAGAEAPPAPPMEQVAGAILANGSFENWKGDSPLPSGAFHGPDPALGTIARGLDAAEDGKICLSQTWEKSDSKNIPDGCFGITVELPEENTEYTVRVQAKSDKGAAAVVAVYGVAADGKLQKIADPCVDNVEVKGNEWKAFEGSFKSGKFKKVQLLTRASKKKSLKFPQTITWDRWEVVKK